MEIKFHIESSTHNLSLVREKIESTKLPISIKNRCAYALIEAVDNAIFHAHAGDVKKNIEIKILVGPSSVTLEVKDQGKGFNLDEVKNPELSATHGRGLLIIKGLMDDVSYESNTLKMRCNL